MYYSCNSCGFIFHANHSPQYCPDCGEPAVRLATEDEKNEHLRLMKIVEADDWDDTQNRGLFHSNLSAMMEKTKNDAEIRE